MPSVTDWYVLADLDYPTGRVNLRPAEVGGLRNSFRHMEGNLPSSSGRPWRRGAPCLDRPGRWLGSSHLVNQPTSAAQRLAWHVVRCREWLEAAATDSLTDRDEPFELPKFAATPLVVGFDEDSTTFATWQPLLRRRGQLQIKKIAAGVCVAYEFAIGAARVLTPRWGRRFRETQDTVLGYWIALPRLPVLPPWNAAKTWGELRSIARENGVNLDVHLQWIYRDLHYRTVKDDSIVLIGFPIPEHYDGPSIRMHWQPLILPPPIDTTDKNLHIRMGKHQTDGAWTYERARLRDDRDIRWMTAEPWAEDRLAVRGSLTEALRTSKIVLIGAGALGSALADLMVRAGVNDVIVLDAEILEVGNVRRHVLTIESLGAFKGDALAAHLNTCSPFARVFSGGHFPDQLGEMRTAVRDADIVIDCTASDDVISRIGEFEWTERERWFFSCSLGVDARRLFCFAHRGASFPGRDFFEAAHPYVNEERKLLQDRDPLTMFGAGCWNPVFPARWDDTITLAARALRIIDEAVGKGFDAAGFKVCNARGQCVS